MENSAIIKNYFVSSKDFEETHVMYANSNNIDIMIGKKKTEEIIENLFKPLLERYQKVLEKSTRGGDFIYDGVELSH